MDNNLIACLVAIGSCGFMLFCFWVDDKLREKNRYVGLRG